MVTCGTFKDESGVSGSNYSGGDTVEDSEEDRLKILTSGT